REREPAAWILSERRRLGVGAQSALHEALELPGPPTSDPVCPEADGRRQAGRNRPAARDYATAGWISSRTAEGDGARRLGEGPLSGPNRRRDPLKRMNRGAVPPRPDSAFFWYGF